ANLTQSSITSYTSDSSVKLTSDEFSDNEFSDNEFDDSEEEFDVDYLCPECSRPRTNDRWCNFCESQKFSNNFNNWTSGNSYLDKIIRDTQLNATSKYDYLVWIDYSEFEDIEYLAKGGYGEVYYGIWIYGPNKVLIYEEEKCKWRKETKTPVALKCLHNSENLTANFLDEMYYQCRNGRVLHCYGITQHKESNNYMMVMEYANGGDLRHYFTYNYRLLSWGQKLRILRDIALGLEVIHSVNLIHRDLHSGNLLLHTLKDGTMRTFVTDLGLCRPIDKPSKNDEYAINLPQNRGNTRGCRIIKSHPKAVYISRLLPHPPNEKGNSLACLYGK
ncbi:11115_t:CDS:2, partial [Racocetra fulgida]